MGPLATAHFLKLIVAADPAKVEQERIPVVVWSDPSIPDRTEALIAEGESPVETMAHGLSRLTAAGAGLIAIPCNTAHAFLPDLQRRCAVPITNMIDMTVRKCANVLPSARVGLLATQGTRISGLYEDAAEALGLTIHHVDARTQEELVDAAIVAVKTDDNSVDPLGLLREAVRVGFPERVDLVVVGCTEISVALDHGDLTAEVVDSSQVLASEVVRLARNPRQSGYRESSRTSASGDDPSSTQSAPSSSRDDLPRQPRQRLSTDWHGQNRRRG